MLSRKLLDLSLLLLLLISGQPLLGQHFSLLPKAISTTPKLDGILDEAIWDDADSATDFQMHFPFDTLKASSATEVRVLFDDQNLYIGAKCFNSKKRNYVIQSLKRDFDFFENEAFIVFLDPFNEGTNGISFAVNPKGVQREGVIPRGGVKGDLTNWDEQWFVEVFTDAAKEYWSVEMMIPLKVIPFSNNNLTWRINFARNDLSQNEISTWAPVERGFDIATLALAGTLNWKKLPQLESSNLTVVPHSAINWTDSYEDNIPSKIKNITGVDGRIRLNSSVSLDFTINPDFSQVEVDEQVIDLNRFELFFPEKRLLFLEKNDLFFGLGNSRVRPYFSRRIGSVGQTPVPILFGARLSGKMKKDWNFGMMTVQTREVKGIADDSQNYSIAAIQKSVLNGSSVTAFVSSRQAFDEFYIYGRDYNRIGGLEFDYRSQNSKWSGKAFLHYSFSGYEKSNGLAYSGKLRYQSTKATIFAGMDAVSKNYLADMGYVPHLFHNYQDTTFRVPYLQYRSNGYYRFFIKKNKKIDFVSIGYRANLFTDQLNFQYQEHDVSGKISLKFINGNELKFTATQYSPKLFFPFWLDGLALPFEAGNYPNEKLSLEFETGKLNRFSWKSYLGWGGLYMGKRFDLRGELNYRFQHFISAGLSFSQQNLYGFPGDYGQADFSWVGSKIEISFHRNLFFTTFLQYNTQVNNFNINSRFNWRFLPMSDLYLVYTENYRADNLGIKDRALVLKISYWLNL